MESLSDGKVVDREDYAYVEYAGGLTSGRGNNNMERPCLSTVYSDEKG